MTRALKITLTFTAAIITSAIVVTIYPVVVALGRR